MANKTQRNFKDILSKEKKFFLNTPYMLSNRVIIFFKLNYLIEKRIFKLTKNHFL